MGKFKLLDCSAAAAAATAATAATAAAAEATAGAATAVAAAAAVRHFNQHPFPYHVTVSNHSMASRYSCSEWHGSYALMSL